MTDSISCHKRPTCTCEAYEQFRDEVLFALSNHGTYDDLIDRLKVLVSWPYRPGTCPGCGRAEAARHAEGCPQMARQDAS